MKYRWPVLGRPQQFSQEEGAILYGEEMLVFLPNVSSYCDAKI